MNESIQSNRKLPQFSLRSMLIALTLAALVLGYGVHVHQQSQRKQALAESLAEFDTYYTTQAQFFGMGGETHFHFTSIHPDPWHNLSFLDREALELLKETDLSRLKHLSLSNNEDLIDADLSFLKNLASLESLDLSSTGVTDEAIVHISQVRSLKELDLGNTTISDEGRAKLVKALPACEFTSLRARQFE